MLKEEMQLDSHDWDHLLKYISAANDYRALLNRGESSYSSPEQWRQVAENYREKFVETGNAIPAEVWVKFGYCIRENCPL